MDLDLWTLATEHSRPLRKLYAELCQLQREMDRIRRSPDHHGHAPSQAVAIGRALRPLQRREAEIHSRIARITLDD